MSNAQPPLNPSPQSVEEFQEVYQHFLGRIADAARAVDRDPAEVRLLPVSKTVPAERLRLAIAAGMTELAENRVQEMAGKATDLADTDVTWCLIGPLQRNKARDAAAFATEFHALDSVRLATALNNRLIDDKVLDVFVQVNTSGEAQKSGVAPEEAAQLLDDLAAFPQLRVRGLMTMAKFSPDEAVVRGSFARLRELRESLTPNLPDGMSVAELSMGMSGDFEWAIAEGATTVRIGRGLFGARPPVGA